MKAPAEHRGYIAKLDYPLGCSTSIFEDDELDLWRRYGFWIEALVDGAILPTTDKQKRLIEVHGGRAEPIHLQECAWRKLIERRAWEKKERASPHYESVDRSEQWFSRSDW
ncbi:MAG: DUF413 domain-containing protein, partial [Verrucomicrobia bacterium]|nr:DUF413 domain-containing protein [Verrucomicrobiota bacterium]